MLFQDLQDQLRTYIRARLSRREWTGSGLCEQAGFQPAHLSNFLNGRRGLSLELMDRLMNALQLDIVDLLNDTELRRVTVQSPPDSAFEGVALVSSADAALLPRLRHEQVRETLNFRRTFLHRLKPGLVGDRSDWQRFVLVKVDSENGRGMLPRIPPGAILLLDRHYNSLQPYRRFQPNVYAVKVDGNCVFRYVTVEGDRVILRPHSLEWPIQLLTVEGGQSYSDYIVGRVCYMGAEF